MKKLFTLIGFLAISLVALSQDEVTLVVSGQGATKDEATTKALRSAIEQAFGVFVSANTEILDDELVKDEIATVSSGNIQKYEELGALMLPNGMNEVTLQATVSVKKLTSYARSHGSSAEFAGATFAANQKMIRLNQQNSAKAIENLYRQIKEMGKDLYDCELTIDDPDPEGYVRVSLSYYANDNARALGNLFLKTIKSVAIPENMVREVSSAVPYKLIYYTDEVKAFDKTPYGGVKGRKVEDIYLYNVLPEIIDEGILEQEVKMVGDSIARLLRGRDFIWGKNSYKIICSIDPLRVGLHGHSAHLTTCSYRFLQRVKFNNMIGVGNFYEIFDNLGNKYDMIPFTYTTFKPTGDALNIFYPRKDKCTGNNNYLGYDEFLEIMDSAGLSRMIFPTDTEAYFSPQKECFVGESTSSAASPYISINSGSIYDVIYQYEIDEFIYPEIFIPKQFTVTPETPQTAKKGLKGKLSLKDEEYYKRIPLFEIQGLIQIPLDRMEKITNLDVKQQ